MGRSRTETVYRDETPLGARLARFLTLLGIVFVVMLAVIVSQRFNTETLALIVGLVIAGIPLLAIAALFGFIAVKAGSRPRNESQQMTIPPIIMQIPQAPQNALPSDMWNLPQRQTTGARTWDVLGEEE